jgi:hypothetical protein
MNPTIAAALCFGATLAACKPSTPPTWYRDVGPIVQARCQACHTSGGIAPFPLLEYEDAVSVHARMATAVRAGAMPPWPPAEGCGSFRDSRRLSQEEIDVIARWSEQGALEGDPADAPAPPAPAQGLPWVDAELSSGPTPYVPVPPTGKSDDYHCFILDPQLAQDRFLIGYEIRPGVRQAVHHVLLFSSDTAAARTRDEQQAGVGWTCFGGPDTGASAPTVGGWAPGTPVTRFPEGTGIRLPAGKVLLMQIHYNRSHGARTGDVTVARLQYSNGAVSRQATMLSIAQSTFSIPPRVGGYSASVRVPASGAGTIWGLLPHMHTLGKRIQVKAGDRCLVDIPKWDFHWQQLYFFSNPGGVPVRAGEVLELTCTWDNPTDRVVRWGEGTSDEMCLNYFYVTG